MRSQGYAESNAAEVLKGVDDANITLLAPLPHYERCFPRLRLSLFAKKLGDLGGNV